MKQHTLEGLVEGTFVGLEVVGEVDGLDEGVLVGL